MFDTKNLNTLEYSKILAKLSSFAQSQGGKALALQVVPFCTLSDSNRALSETAEAERVLFNFSVNPSFAIDDVSDILKKAQKGSILGISDILKVGRTLRVARRIDKALKEVTEIPILEDMTNRLYFSPDLEKQIFDTFITESEIADKATNELRIIRIRIRKLNANIKTKLQSYITSSSYSKYLQDNIVTMRGDRYVIPVKSDCKGAISGLVHDQSASGSTLFVEPMQVVELNNELKVELMNEQAEIEKILKNFSSMINSVAGPISWSYQAVVDMDLIFAKAQLAMSQKAIRPILNEEGLIKIENGRHPLIDKDKVVPSTMVLYPDEKMLLITGPNTGGKTVTLKLVGLFVAMSMSGLYIPAKSANLSIFDGVYCDIGDEQSIEQSLSTFSGHIKNIISILDKITDKSLVLFDELGAGTDPGEGASLAVSISEHLLNVGAKCFITSHFNDLKEFALTTENVKAASMEFDSVSLSPTFKLVMGAIGSSNALAIAERLGLSSNIVENAKSKISSEKRQFDNVLTAAEETRRHAQKLVSDANLDREKAASALRDAEKEKQIIIKKKEKLDENIRKETKRLIEDSVEEANNTIDQIKELLNKKDLETADLFTARKLKKQLETMSAEYDKDEIIEFKEDKSSINKGDFVFSKSLGKKGKVVKINKRGEAEIMVGKLNIKVKKGDYYKVKL